MNLLFDVILIEISKYNRESSESNDPSASLFPFYQQIAAG